ncbi:MAG: uracil phosphoribosyltransferase [Bdellovibrionales bacterium]|nr:uracil phosphoribosyltransferase [Bdellovibrionales bacterium]
MLEHKYGEQICILDHLTLTTLLNKLSRPETTHPELGLLLKASYEILLTETMNLYFHKEKVSSQTRMKSLHKEGVLVEQNLTSPDPVITVNLARAGTFPSQICFDYINLTLGSKACRQDHFYVNRKVDDKNRVVGVDCTGSKIGGPVENSLVLIPDPMGATGGTICHVLDHYKSIGNIKQFIALHLIITPEYIIKVKEKHPELIVVAGRIDRGLSHPEILETIPGTYIDKEKGLNENSYIVPGAGGVGELLNNAEY